MQTEETTISRINFGREDQLQFLRFLAFLNVYLYHAESWLFFRYPVSHCAAAAVSFFFMLSGMVTGYSHYGKEIRISLKTCGKYMWKKLCKLYPLYFCTILFTFILSGIPEMIAMLDFSSARDGFAQLLRALLMIQSWFREGYFAYNGVGWFLSSMVFLYALNLPTMFVLNKIDKHTKRYFIFVLLLGGLLFATMVYCYLTQQYDMSYWHYIFPPARMGEYFAGMILGVMLRSLKPRLKTGKAIRILFTVLEIAVLICWFRSLYSPGNYWRNHIVSWLVPNLAILSVFTIGAGWISILFRCGPLVRMGNVSFECYLLHQIVINMYTSFNSIPETSVFGGIFSFLFCLVATLAFALVLNKKNGQSAE